MIRSAAFPFRIGGDGRTSLAEPDAHARQMIELALFSAPGERVNRPDFGSGLRELVFAGNSQELAAAAEFRVQGALQQWLGDVIKVEGVVVTSDENVLSVTVQYVIRQNQERHIAQFSQEI